MTGMVGSFVGWLSGLLAITVFCLAAGALGYTGLLIRRGRKWSIFMWLTVYVILFLTLPLKFFLLLLLLLVPVILGLFRTFLTPDPF
jgi:hypothetical protein